MLEVITPEAAGIHPAHLSEYLSYLERRGVVLHSILMMRGNNIVAEYYYKPFHMNFCHRMYSQTKSYVSIAIGLLAEEGKLRLDDAIADYFPEKFDKEPHPFFKLQTIRQMLFMETSGETPGWFGSGDPDRVHLYFNTNTKPYPAGMRWEYDSHGSQVLSALVEKLSGMPLLDYLKRKLFDHMGTFQTAQILKTPNGDSWGDSALVCTPRDMASFARFVMNYGTWNGQRLMNEEYLRLATSKVVDNNLSGFYSSSGHGYGYQIWRTEQNGFAFLGMGCQDTICLPDRDFIFVCTGDNQGNEYARQIIHNGLFDYVINRMSDSPIDEDICAREKLREQTADLNLWYLNGIRDTDFCRELNGQVYICQDNPQGIREFSLVFHENGEGEFRYINAQGSKVLPFGICKNVFCKFPQYGYSNEAGAVRTKDGFLYDAAVSAAWLEEQKFMIKVQIIDRYFGNLAMVFSFKDDWAVISMEKNAEDFLDEYCGIVVAHKKP